LSRTIRVTLAALLLVAALFTACKGEEEYAEAEAFSFVVYPGSRYLGQLTDMTKRAHKLVNPSVEPPATAIYDSEAPVEEVANYYVKEYGYKEIASEEVTKAASVKPLAGWRSGDLTVDTTAIEPVTKQLGLTVDMTKAVGAYKAVEVMPRPNRPRVTIQRPYFDVTTSQVVDRTLILMSR
jgi:hypothetical protein